VIIIVVGGDGVRVVLKKPLDIDIKKRNNKKKPEAAAAAANDEQLHHPSNQTMFCRSSCLGLLPPFPIHMSRRWTRQGGVDGGGGA
jgi:hypothetical protein